LNDNINRKVLITKVIDMDRKTWKLFKNVDKYPDDLKPKDIDLEIRDAIFKINKSGWVWSVFSCAGHKKNFQTSELEIKSDGNYRTGKIIKVYVFLAFIVETPNIGKLLSCVYNAFNENFMNIEINNYKFQAIDGYEKLTVHIYVKSNIWNSVNPDYSDIFDKLHAVRIRVECSLIKLFREIAYQ
jgi:hypothetical protein